MQRKRATNISKKERSQICFCQKPTKKEKRGKYYTAIHIYFIFGLRAIQIAFRFVAYCTVFGTRQRPWLPAKQPVSQPAVGQQLCSALLPIDLHRLRSHPFHSIHIHSFKCSRAPHNQIKEMCSRKTKTAKTWRRFLRRMEKKINVTSHLVTETDEKK